MNYEQGDKVIILNQDCIGTAIVEGLALLVELRRDNPNEYPQWFVKFEDGTKAVRIIYPQSDIYDCIIYTQSIMVGLKEKIKNLKTKLNDEYGSVKK